MTISVLNTKIVEVENNIPDTSGLVITSVPNKKIGEVEKKLPDVSDSVRKTDHNTKISDNEAKYFTTSYYNKFTKEILDAKIKDEGLVDKSDISNLVKNSDLNKKLATLATNAKLKVEQDKTGKLQAFVSGYFLVQSHIEDDGPQNYLVLQPVPRYFKMVADTNKVTGWKQKGLFN